MTTPKKAPTELNLTPIDQELDLELLQKAEADDTNDNDSDTVEFKLNSRRDERQLALYLLYALDRCDYSIPLETVTKTFEQGFDINIQAKSFALNMVQGVTDKRESLDEYLKPFLKSWPLERLGCCTRLILYLALWELQEKSAASSIVINEAVELAKTFAEKDAYRFINGILDEISKKMAGTTEEPQKLQES